MYLRLTTVLFICAMSLVACQQDKSNTTTEGQDTNKPAQKPPKHDIGTIEGIPERIVGCSCLLSANKEDYKNDRFIIAQKTGMMDPRENLSIMKIDGKEITWHTTTGGPGFTVEVFKAQTQSGDPEDEEVEGKLYIKFDDGAVIEKTFYGYCGC